MLVIFQDWGDARKVWWRAEFPEDVEVLPIKDQTIQWAVEDMRFVVMDVRHVFDMDASTLVLQEPRAKQGAIIVELKKVPSPRRVF